MYLYIDWELPRFLIFPSFPQLLTWGPIFWGLTGNDHNIEKICYSRSSLTKHMFSRLIIYVKMPIKNKKVIQGKYSPVSLNYLYSSNQIVFFFIRIFLFLQLSSRSFIAMVRIAHMTLIISLQMKEKNCEVCGFQSRL